MNACRMLIDFRSSYKCFRYVELRPGDYWRYDKLCANPANNYLFKVNNRKIRKSYEIRSKLTIKTP